MPPRVVRAPEPLEGPGPALFLAGGISGCPDWQGELISLLAELPERVTLLDPRRSSFDLADRSVAPAQIEWEHRHLRLATGVVFWFPEETLCPITLYELGAWSMTRKPLWVGCHPRYARRFDVETQTRLARPDVVVESSVEGLASRVVREITV